jgi:hypothetical protein
VETSTFGSKYIAAKIAIEMVDGQRYKLWIMGSEVSGTTAMFCDNESVVKSSKCPESTLQKKHNVIAYHRVREAQVAKTVAISHIARTATPVDIFMKSLPGWKLKDLTQYMLW